MLIDAVLLQLFSVIERVLIGVLHTCYHLRGRHVLHQLVLCGDHVLDMIDSLLVNRAWCAKEHIVVLRVGLLHLVRN